MAANTQVAYTQLDEEVSTFYHRYAHGKENSALFLAAFGCLENSVTKAALIATDQSFELPLVTEENLKLCLGGIEGLSLNTKEIHRTFLANAPLEAKQIQLLSNSDRLLTMASEMEALSHRYYTTLANQKMLVQSFTGQGKGVKVD